MSLAAGWAREDIAIVPRGLAMQGYGKWHQRDTGQKMPLFARAVVVRDDSGGALILCCLDLGYVTHAMRQGICAALLRELGDAFDADRLVLTCTHTHSGPGGCTHDIMYNLVTPGFAPDYLARIIHAASMAILSAWRNAAPCELRLGSGTFDDGEDVAWNRSIAAYNRNPEVTARGVTETHLALDRTMQVLTFVRDGRIQALLSLFGVHATCIGSLNTLYDGDNKGRAALHAEARLREAGAPEPVAIFAQATAGDVSPHYHGPGQAARRRRLRGEAEHEYAERNGALQAERALSVAADGGVLLDGGIDAIFEYADFTAITADPEFAGGRDDAVTSDPCHGAAFFGGTPVDGPGLPKPFLFLVRQIAAAIKRRRLSGRAANAAHDRAYYARLYASQGPKAIMQEAGRKLLLGQTLDRIAVPDFIDPAVAEIKRQARCGAMRDSDMVPTILPVQIVTIGALALVCAPGEFTTVAGARLRRGVAAELPDRFCHVLLCTYCNDYMGYVTSVEEYQAQAYEGGHTMFGQWTLAAFQTKFAALARAMHAPPNERAHDRITAPSPAPPHELALRTAP